MSREVCRRAIAQEGTGRNGNVELPTDTITQVPIGLDNGQYTEKSPQELRLQLHEDTGGWRREEGTFAPPWKIHPNHLGNAKQDRTGHCNRRCQACWTKTKATWTAAADCSHRRYLAFKIFSLIFGTTETKSKIIQISQAKAFMVWIMLGRKATVIWTWDTPSLTQQLPSGQKRMGCHHQYTGVAVCLHSLPTWSQISKHAGAPGFICHKVQFKGPFLMLPLGSHTHHIGLEPWAVSTQENNSSPRSLRRQQARLCCLRFSVSLNQLCACFSSTDTKIGTTETSMALHTHEAFQILTRRRIWKWKKRYKERRKSQTGKRKGEGGDRIVPVLLCRI